MSLHIRELSRKQFFTFLPGDTGIIFKAQIIYFHLFFKSYKVTIVNPKLMPMINYITRKKSNPHRFNIYAVPLKDYNNEMAKKHLQPELAQKKKLVKLYKKTVDKKFRTEY